MVLRQALPGRCFAMFSLWRRFVSWLAPPLLHHSSGDLSGRRRGSAITSLNTDHTQWIRLIHLSTELIIHTEWDTQTHTLHIYICYFWCQSTVCGIILSPSRTLSILFKSHHVTLSNPPWKITKYISLSVSLSTDDLLTCATANGIILRCNYTFLIILLVITLTYW